MWLLMLTGLFFMIFGLYRLFINPLYKPGSLTLTAEVVGCKKRIGGRGATCYYPILRYSAGDKTFTQESVTDTYEYENSQILKIKVHPSRLEEPVVVDFSGYAGPFIFIILGGGIFILMCLIITLQ